ncbi:hypothetical protein [Mesorhizobium sp. M0058]|uniref:hypothetical protein n=1 Tax=Mesorhizobium sp. M0058 TaxID=2956865 RepID=UPI003337CDCC
MAKRKVKKRDPDLFLIAKIESQEIELGPSYDVSEEPPYRIGTHIELLGELEAPLKGVTALGVSISELRSPLRESWLKEGMIFAVKPVVRVSLWVDRRGMDHLVALATARRLTDVHLWTKVPRYGKAQLINWSLRTAPDE